MNEKKGIVIRTARESDRDRIVEMLKRLKKLNEEFDTHFTVSENVEKNSKEYLSGALKDTENRIFLVADSGSRVEGFMEVFLRKRIYYTPEVEARILEFYVMPEYRSKGLGKRMVNELIKELQSRKIKLISSEFPSMNLIAKNFYEKLGFRQLLSIYGKRVDQKRE